MQVAVDSAPLQVRIGAHTRYTRTAYGQIRDEDLAVASVLGHGSGGTVYWLVSYHCHMCI